MSVPITLPRDQLFKTVPYQHQIEALMLSREQTNFALLMEMGTGKSKVVIDTASYLFSQGKINCLVVMSPKSVTRGWSTQQVEAHLPNEIDRIVLTWGDPMRKFRDQEEWFFEDNKNLMTTLRVFSMNVEAVATDKGYDYLEKILRSFRCLLVVDEATTIKNPSAKRTKALTKLGKLAKYRRILTGTPVTNSPLDVYAPFNFLEEGLLQCTSFISFRNRYAVTRKRQVNGRAFDEVVGYQRLDELQKLISKVSFRALKKDCLDLPEKIYTTRYIELTPEQRAYYKSLKEDALAWLSNGDLVTAPLVITRLLRFRQCLCNIAPTEDKDTLKLSAHSPRADEVMKILEETQGQKVIIWSNFIPSINNLANLIAETYGPDSVAKIYGDISGPDRQSIVERFQDSNNPLSYIVSNPRTGGFGITLTAATVVIYHDHDWSLEVRLQSEDRCHRIGQKHNVTYIDLVSPGTIDEKIVGALRRKEDLASQVSGDNLRKILEDHG